MIEEICLEPFHVCCCSSGRCKPHKLGDLDCDRRHVRQGPRSAGNDIWEWEGRRWTLRELADEAGWHLYRCGCWSRRN